MVSDNAPTQVGASEHPSENRKTWETPSVRALGDLAQLTGSYGEGKYRGATDWVNSAGSSVYGARVG